MPFTKIPPLASYLGAWTGDERFEIATSGNVDTALSRNVAARDILKVIGALSDISPTPAGNFRVGLFRVSDGAVFSRGIDQLGIPVGNVPPGGLTGQVLAKLSNADFDDNWANLVFTGEVTGSGALPLALTIANNAVTTVKILNNAVDNTKLADMAQGTVKLRPAGGGTGDPVDGTAAQLAAILGLPSVSTDNAVPRFNGIAGALESTLVIISDGNDLTVPRGLRVGFAGTPADDVVEVGDANFKLDWNAGTVPFFLFDAGDLLAYNRSTNNFDFQIGSVVRGTLNASSFSPGSSGGLTLGTAALPFGNAFLTQTAKIDFGNGDVIIQAAANALSLTGASAGYSFDATIIATGGGQAVIIRGATGTDRYTELQTGTTTRWVYGVSGGTESGGNAASNFFWNRYNDAGVYLSTPVQIIRSTGLVTIGEGLSVSNGLVVNNGSITVAGGGVTVNNGQILANGGITGNSAMNTATGSLGEVMTQGNGTGAAMMAFLRPGVFAAYFGLDTDNQWKVGGWSMGANAFVVFHTGNTANLMIGTITFIIDGGGATITTGIKGDVEIPFACTITGWTILGDQSGSIVVDVWKDTYGNFPPTVADTIAGSEKPTISATTKGQDLSLSTWTTSVAAGDTIRFNVDSITTLQRVTLSIRFTKGQ